MPLANLCIHAATTYWNYLDQNNKGVIEHQVLARHDLGDGVWTLQLARGYETRVKCKSGLEASYYE